jgi:excisionase family DNA binding protein
MTIPKTAPRAAPPSPLLTVAEAADLWTVSTKTVRREIKAGRLSVVRFGRAIRIRREAVEDRMRSK